MIMSTAPGKEPERRRFLRIQFDGSTEIRIGIERYPVKLLDLSLKGALIECPIDLESQPGDSLQLVIHLTNCQEQLNLNVVLVRQFELQYGFRFDEVDIDTLTHLRRLVELNLGDEAMLERELEHLFPLK